LLKCTGTFGFSCTQSVAEAAISVYIAKTMNSTVEVQHNWDLQKWCKAENVYLKKCSGKDKVEVLERMTLKSIMRTV
jgi:hypothetical protein